MNDSKSQRIGDEKKIEEKKIEEKSVKAVEHKKPPDSIIYKPSTISKLPFVTPTQHFRVIQLYKRFDSKCTGWISFEDALGNTEEVLKQDFRSDQMCSLIGKLEAKANEEDDNMYIQINDYFEIINAVQLKMLSFLSQKEEKLSKQRKKLHMDEDELLDVDEDEDLKLFNNLGCCSRFCFDLWKKIERRSASQNYGIIWKRRFAQIEARFGGSVVTYFLFARYIFLLNLITALFFLPIVIPGWIKHSPQSAGNYFGLIFGNGMKYSWMFYGTYFPTYWGWYRMDLIWIASLVSMILLALFAVLRSMDQRFDLHSEDQKKLKFSNLVFCQFDHNLMSKSAISLRQASLKKQLVTLVDEYEQKHKKQEKLEKSPLSIYIRIFLGWLLSIIFGLGTAAGVGYLIYYEDCLLYGRFCTFRSAADQCLEEKDLGTGDLRDEFAAMSIPIIISILKAVNPAINRVIVALFEGFQDGPTKFRLMFARTFIIKMFYVLVILFNTVYKSQLSCKTCTETDVGMIYYKLLIVDMIMQFLLGVIAPFIVLRAKQCCCPKIFKSAKINNKDELDDLGNSKSKKEKEDTFLHHYLPEADSFKKVFKIEESILNIMYIQALVWSGTPYCPFLPFLASITSFLLIYIKLFQVRHWSKPHEKPMGVAEQNHFFRGLMIVTLAICIVPFSFFLHQPIKHCGPHWGGIACQGSACKTPAETLFDQINRAPAWVSLSFEYLQSSIFLWVMVLLVAIYALFSRKREKMLHKELVILRKRLRIEMNEKSQILRDNGIILGSNVDKDRGKKMFNTWMTELGAFGSVFKVKFQEAYFGDILELVSLTDDELIAVMEGFGNKEVSIPKAHIIFFLRQLERKRIELIS